MFHCYECDAQIEGPVWKSRCVSCVVKKLEANLRENEELRKRLAVAESEIPKWIPVSEALPPYFESVLAIRENCTGRPYYATMYRDNKWCDIVSTEIIDVTHWMPLHEVPKIGKGE